jgi:TrmH family RNA methyltransferase
MINSEKNQKAQLVRSLNDQRKMRKNNAAFVIEGVRLLEEAFQAGWEIKFVLFTHNLSARGVELIENCKKVNVIVEEITDPIMEKLTETETPQGVIAVVTQTVQKIPENLNFVLICDGIRDPGNLGTIMRTAAATGVQAIFLTPGTTDPYSPKVVRSGMGAHFFVPIFQNSWEEIDMICHNREFPLQIYVSLIDAKENLWQKDLTKPIAIVVGSEAEGVSEAAIHTADDFLSIPMPGRTESLNAASAASILLYEVTRQRAS